MKAKAFRDVNGTYLPCEPAEATHLMIDRPGPGGGVILPVMIGGRREGTPNWTWNGDLEKPTLKPSILSRGHDFTCHSFVNDGRIQFLGDCTHEFANQTLDLLEVD